MKRKVPQTAEEWQEGVDLASFLLVLDSAKEYGLLEGGPDVKRERCRLMIECGAARGITPAPRDVLIKRYIPGMLLP